MHIGSLLVNELTQKDYRDAYVAAQINVGIPFQIRALRNQRHWNQAEFASRVGMAQPRVSEMERPGERRLTIETLLRLAAAFDVGLQIRFVSFSTLVEWAEDFSPDTFAVPSFHDEMAEQATHPAELHASVTAGSAPETQQCLWRQMQTQKLAPQWDPDASPSAAKGAIDLAGQRQGVQLGSIVNAGI